MIYSLHPRGKFIKLADFLQARVTFDHDGFNLDVPAELPVGKSDTKRSVFSVEQPENVNFGCCGNHRQHEHVHV